jgi:hypothetical protein
MNEKVKLGIVDFKQSINGIEVLIPTELSIGIKANEDKFQICIDAISNLSDIQNKFQQIVQTFPLPNDTSGYGTKFVVNLENAKLEPSGDNAYFESNFSCTVWQIEKGIPLGGTTCGTREECVEVWTPFGTKRLCANVPYCDWLPGDDIKTSISEGFNAKINFQLNTPNFKDIKLGYSNLDISPRGDIGKFINQIAEIFNRDINNQVVEMLDKNIGAKLYSVLPDEIEKFSPEVRTIQFTTLPENQLGILVKFKVDVTGEQLNEILVDALD